MTSWNATHTDILKAHARPIAHMWRQIRANRFGLVLGAGVSLDFDPPDWDTLLARIAADPKVHGTDVVASQIGAPASSLAQILFQHFASRVLQKEGHAVSREELKRSWRDVIRRQLYRKARNKEFTYLRSHYMREHLPIIRRIPMTVTYNFDDFVKRFLDWERDTLGAEHTRAKPYDTIWRPDIQTRRSRRVIYHPNGFVPRNDAEPESDGLVFCEDEFSDQLIKNIAGRYASLLHFFSKYTCLLIGLSLNDATLKYLLRHNAQLNRGDFHYYIVYEKDGATTPDAVRTTIFQANCELHNLISVLMTGQEIGG